MIRQKNKSVRRPHRLKTEQWLELALDFLASEGREKLTIDNLVSALGVTKGSFYWHFRDRHDFQVRLLRFWDERYTQVVIEHLATSDAGPAERLWTIMEIVCQQELTRYEVAIRAWAAQEPAIFDLVQTVDESRIRIVRSLFEELGFRGTELEMRTRSYATYVTFDLGISVRQSKRQRLNCLRQFHAMIIRRSTKRAKTP
jgi:AcrR family transcriptional regulator